MPLYSLFSLTLGKHKGMNGGPVSVVRNVHFFPAADDTEARHNNNPGPVAAIVTRVLDEESGKVNLTIFPDGLPPVTRSDVAFRLHTQYDYETNFGVGQRAYAYWDWPVRKQ